MPNTVADPEIEKGGALPPDRTIPGIMCMRTKLIRARVAQRTEKKGGPGLPGPPPGSATETHTCFIEFSHTCKLIIEHSSSSSGKKINLH